MKAKNNKYLWKISIITDQGQKKKGNQSEMLGQRKIFWNFNYMFFSKKEDTSLLKHRGVYWKEKTK